MLSSEQRDRVHGVRDGVSWEGEVAHTGSDVLRSGDADLHHQRVHGAVRGQAVHVQLVRYQQIAHVLRRVVVFLLHPLESVVHPVASVDSHRARDGNRVARLQSTEAHVSGRGHQPQRRPQDEGVR